MPAKNSIKIYLENGYYHLYNRGTNKSEIFIDSNDYQYFLRLIKNYLEKEPAVGYFTRTLNSRINLLAFCLMPNHYHFLVKQNDANAITPFIRRISIAYSLYFNRKYRRLGPVFQGKYKACLIDTNSYLIHLTKYIHLNPTEILKPNGKISAYPYSSLPAYLDLVKYDWLDVTEITNIYKDEFGSSFQKYLLDHKPVSLIQSLLLDEPAEYQGGISSELRKFGT